MKITKRTLARLIKEELNELVEELRMDRLPQAAAKERKAFPGGVTPDDPPATGHRKLHKAQVEGGAGAPLTPEEMDWAKLSQWTGMGQDDKVLQAPSPSWGSAREHAGRMSDPARGSMVKPYGEMPRRGGHGSEEEAREAGSTGWGWGSLEEADVQKAAAEERAASPGGVTAGGPQATAYHKLKGAERGEATDPLSSKEMGAAKRLQRGGVDVKAPSSSWADARKHSRSLEEMMQEELYNVLTELEEQGIPGRAKDAFDELDDDGDDDFGRPAELPPPSAPKPPPRSSPRPKRRPGKGKSHPGGLSQQRKRREDIKNKGKYEGPY